MYLEERHRHWGDPNRVATLFRRLQNHIRPEHLTELLPIARGLQLKEGGCVLTSWRQHDMMLDFKSGYFASHALGLGLNVGPLAAQQSICPRRRRLQLLGNRLATRPYRFDTLRQLS
jgi:hypothetical protein